MADVLVCVENLHVRFRTYAGVVHAVNGVSFDIRRGETFGLVGETGCGKSVTGLSLLRLVPPPGEIAAGRILFNGEDLLAKSEAEMQRIRGRRIAMVFQDPAATLNPVFSVGEQIMGIIRHHQAVGRDGARRRAMEMLEAVGLPEPERLLRAYPHELSGGMQQRVMIAMALSSGAELLIADEPTTALDVTIQAQILALLVELQRSRRLSILLITHNLGVVAETCERVGVLYAGHLVEVGRTPDVFQAMKHPYTQALLAAIPRPGSHGQPLPAIPGTVPSGLERIPGCAFHPRCPFVMDVCRAEKPPLVSVGEEHTVACYLYPQGDCHLHGARA
ncbi:MAG: ABC transporter ATP-binding protein [Anaerolineae bacterium]|nr:ABC transporter ATP-binding protein [Anaerolineae bacterium]